MKKILFFIFCFSLLSVPSMAQDSIRVLTIQDFFAIVLRNHPVAKQAELLDDQAKMELRMVRGFFDPSLNSKFSKKEFRSEEYFTLWDSYLSIPTWYGIDFRAGYERNVGPYVSREKFTPSEGLSYVGVSIPIGQGLIIDERRAQIRMAQQFLTIAEAEKVKVLNKLLLQAAKDYWDWMYHYNKWLLYQEGFRLASIRYDAVSERVKYGDLSAIDTVEAMMQVQTFQILIAQSELEYRNSSLIVSNYLWNDDGAPVQVTDAVIPSEDGSEITPLPAEAVAELINQAKSNHPDILKLNAKLVQLGIERRFIADKFKPKLNIEYNFLQSDFFANSDMFSSGILNNNYKLGASFSYPLFLRNERGKYNLTKLKIQETRYDLQQVNREIENEIQINANEWIALERQIIFQESLVRNSDALRTGEQIRFDNGESSIFLINARENSLISNQVKLYELRSKYAKSKTELQWAAGSVQ